MLATAQKDSIREELTRARGALAASSLLFDGGFTGEAISRLFFALLYQVRAFLRSRGFEPQSHEDALRLLSGHVAEAGSAADTARVVRDGNVVGAAGVADSASRVFSRLRILREKADEGSLSFSREEYYRLRTEAAAVAAALDTEMKVSGFSN